MRTVLLPLVLSLAALATAACGGDDEILPPDARVQIDAPITPTPDARPVDAAPAIDSAPGTPDATPAVDAMPAVDAAPNAPPSIASVSWVHGAGCATGVLTTVTVTTSASDDAAGLVYSGSVPGCTGMISSATAMITCPEAAPYTGTVTVTDVGGLTDSQMITIAPCINGMAP